MPSTVTPLGPFYNDPQVEGKLPASRVNQYNAMALVNRPCPQYDQCYPRFTKRKCLVAMGHEHQLPRVLFYRLNRFKRELTRPSGLGEFGVVAQAPTEQETVVEQDLLNPTEDARIALRTAQRLADAIGRRAYIVGSFLAKPDPSKPARYFVPVVYVQPGGLVRLLDDRPVGTTRVVKLTPFEYRYQLAMGYGINLLPEDA